MAIKLNVTANTDQARTDIRELNSSIAGSKEPLETANKHTRDWADSWKDFTDRINVVKGSISVFKNTVETLGKIWDWGEKAVSVMKNLASSAGEAQIETQRFQFGVEAAGLSWDSVSKSADVFIDKMIQTSRFSDEELKASLQLGVRLFQDYAVAERMTATAADFAAATGKGFIQAQQDIRRALETGGSAIKRYDAALAEQIDTIRKLHPAQEAQVLILTLLEERFKGAAARELENYSALLVQQKNAIANLHQTIGSLLLPVFSVLTKNWTEFVFLLDAAIKKSEGFRRVMEVFTEFANSVKSDGTASKVVIEQIVRVLDNLGENIEIVTRTFMAVISTIVSFTESGTAAKDIMSTTADIAIFLSDVVTSILIAAIKGLGTIIIAAVAYWDPFKKALTIVKDSIILVALTIQEYGIIAFNAFLEIIGTVLIAFGDLTSSAGELISSVADTASSLLTILVPALGLFGETELAEKIRGVGEQLKSVGAAAKSSGEDVDKFRRGLDLETKIGEVTKERQLQQVQVMIDEDAFDRSMDSAREKFNEMAGVLADKLGNVQLKISDTKFTSEVGFKFDPMVVKVVAVGSSPTSDVPEREVISKQVADEIYSQMIRDPKFRDLFTKGTRRDQQEMMAEIYRQSMEGIRALLEAE